MDVNVFKVDWVGIFRSFDFLERDRVLEIWGVEDGVGRLISGILRFGCLGWGGFGYFWVKGVVGGIFVLLVFFFWWW